MREAAYPARRRRRRRARPYLTTLKLYAWRCVTWTVAAATSAARVFFTVELLSWVYDLVTFRISAAASRFVTMLVTMAVAEGSAKLLRAAARKAWTCDGLAQSHADACVFCLSAPAAVLFLPCQHWCCCAACKDGCAAAGWGPGGKCPQRCLCANDCCMNT